MPFFSISSLRDWTSFCCRCSFASTDVTRPWNSALARLPASHSLSARCTSTYANFISARAGTAADVTTRNAPNNAPMNNRCLIQPGKPPVDYPLGTRPNHGASLVLGAYTQSYFTAHQTQLLAPASTPDGEKAIDARAGSRPRFRRRCADRPAAG